jgi:uncharacterized damage-inducible protein DinB
MRSLVLPLLVLAGSAAHPLHAQNEEPRMPATLAEGLLARFDEASGKIVQLAEAIPADQYPWRPAPESRAISEVLVHVGMGNYYTLDNAGLKPQVKLTENEESTVRAKPQVIDFLRRSNQQMRKSLERLKSADLSRPATMFDQKTTVGNVYLFGVTHLHEHLGQLVSYARANGVTPPWSVKRPTVGS